MGKICWIHMAAGSRLTTSTLISDVQNGRQSMVKTKTALYNEDKWDGQNEIKLYSTRSRKTKRESETKIQRGNQQHNYIIQEVTIQPMAVFLTRLQVQLYITKLTAFDFITNMS